MKFQSLCGWISALLSKDAAENSENSETEATDMKFIIGLGNPGKDYAGTRHNIGFEVIDRLAADLGIDINRAKHRAHLGEGFLGARKIMLVKPNTYMNLSGEGVRDILRFYKRTSSDMIVIYDDCDISLGQIRVRERGSAGSHNGMRNIVYQLETDEFLRVRVGIGEKPPRMELAKYVLSRFAKHETEDAAAGVQKAADAAVVILKDGAIAAMNKFNVKI